MLLQSRLVAAVGRLRSQIAKCVFNKGLFKGHSALFGLELGFCFCEIALEIPGMGPQF